MYDVFVSTLRFSKVFYDTRIFGYYFEITLTIKESISGFCLLLQIFLRVGIWLMDMQKYHSKIVFVWLDQHEKHDKFFDKYWYFNNHKIE